MCLNKELINIVKITQLDRICQEEATPTFKVGCTNNSQAKIIIAMLKLPPIEIGCLLSQEVLAFSNKVKGLSGKFTQ